MAVNSLDKFKQKQKKSFRTAGSDKSNGVKQALMNAAARRGGTGAPGRFGSKGAVSGGGMSPAANFAANSKGKFVPRTVGGRPVGDGAGPPDRQLGGPGGKNGNPFQRPLKK